MPSTLRATRARTTTPGIRLVVDHFPKKCRPSEYHLKSIKRLERRATRARTTTPD